MSNLLCVCMLLCFSITAKAGDDLSILIKASDKKFSIPLAANPTTGFQWSVVSYNSKFLKLINSRFQQAQTNKIGAGGQMVFTFALKKANTISDPMVILFKYARPWEGKGATLRKVTVRIH